MNSKLIMKSKIMRTLILCALVICAPVLFVGGGEKTAQAAQQKKTTKSQVRYACPMHAEVTSVRPPPSPDA